MRACTCAGLIWAAPTPPAAISIVPLVVIGPPVRLGPVLTVVTVPLPPTKSAPQLTVPSALTARTFWLEVHDPVTRACTCAVLIWVVPTPPAAMPSVPEPVMGPPVRV